ncbi:TPA: DUF1508 domain-containing protein [Escherichia coli]|nr:DUF1508 domain-containing protein [Escherichia coli]EFA4943354.1 DUF1508 domain-containing protein [Escherichia coli]EFA5471443.1 DUF1508 domain-containing protein [Escherichia coli]EFA5495716.1 DUF1508 domain-containing protein [Escherichia coli]EFA5504652.1 DUF1508 domain-containing protein [Escherichia coli]
MNDKWEFYIDSANEWRWRRVASNGRIVGASSQGYVGVLSRKPRKFRHQSQ